MKKKKILKDKSDLFAGCTYCPVDVTKMPPIKRQELVTNHVIESDMETVMISSEDISRYCIMTDAVDWGNSWFDEDRLREELLDWVGEYPHYLVLALNCRWDGSDGYMLTNVLTDTVIRNYEIAISPDRKIRKGAAFLEYSHDVPQGATTYIIGLTEREYSRLSKADFDTVHSFVLSCDAAKRQDV